MLAKTLITILAVLGLLFGWIFVQKMARRAAARRPECGPYREAGSSCGCCGSAASCDSANKNS